MEQQIKNKYNANTHDKHKIINKEHTEAAQQIPNNTIQQMRQNTNMQKCKTDAVLQWLLLPKVQNMQNGSGSAVFFSFNSDTPSYRCLCIWLDFLFGSTDRFLERYL